MTVIPPLQPPSHSGSRDQAKALVAALPADLSGESVALDCSGLTVSTPSFLDEVVKEILVARRARLLDVLDASDRVRVLLERAAGNRGVGERLRVAVRTP